MLDDIHFLMGKKETQEELFNTFEALYNSNKQLVFTCDRPVTELKDMNERLISRFGRGLSVDLQAPQYQIEHRSLSVLPVDSRHTGNKGVSR